MSLIELSELHTYYGLAYVLQGVSLMCEEGEAVALLGRNGQGKTTTIKSVMSLVVPRRGRVMFTGENITGESPHSISRKGISMVPESRRIFPALTVLDHLRVPVTPPKVDRAERLTFVFDLFPELKARKRENARALSGGQQQMLVIARALMTKPKLLLLDEPMEGLSPILVKRVLEALTVIRESGVTIFFASTNCELAFRIANRAYIMEKGRIVHHADRDELLNDVEVQRDYLGVRG